MENENKPTLGGGIIAVSVIQLILYILSLILYIFAWAFRDKLIEILKESAKYTDQMGTIFSTTNLSIEIIIVVLTIISTILILSKKVLGVYIYFLITIVNIIFSIALSGFSTSILLSLILPVLMAIFIFQKREIYGFGSKNTNINM